MDETKDRPARHQTPSRKQCSAGFSIALANSERLLRGAKHIAEQGDFGLGASLVILAAEEAVKALVLFSSGFALSIPQKYMQSILYKHEARHAAAVLGTFVEAMTSFLLPLIMDVEERVPDKSGPEFQNEKSEVVRKLVEHLEKMASDDYQDQFTKELEWWSKAGELKETGLYVDFRNRRWVSPDSLSQVDFESSLKVVERFIQNVKSGLSVIDTLPPERRLDLIELSKKYGKRSKRSSASRGR